MLLATIDFHVTSECSQNCPYCWGPEDVERPVDTATALRIVSHVKQLGARRIVFTGGDPVRRTDLVQLIRRAHRIGLEIALSTTGDQLTEGFLNEAGHFIDLISLPLDGSTEDVNARSKEPDHYLVIMAALALLARYPSIDVKVCTPVTRLNLADLPNVLSLLEEYSSTTNARVFWNVFQTYPRSFSSVDWQSLLVTDKEFACLERRLSRDSRLRVNFLDHHTLDGLYVLVFPDGELVIPSGERFTNFGPFLHTKKSDLPTLLDAAHFDSLKHLEHSKSWRKRPIGARTH